MTQTIGTRARNGSLNAMSSRKNETMYRGDRGGVVYVGTDISFDNATSTITSSGNAFPVSGLNLVGEIISVTGSALNSREFRVVSAAVGAIVVEPALVRTESAGASIMIRTV